MRREILAAQKSKTELRLFTLGDKGRAQLARCVRRPCRCCPRRWAPRCHAPPPCNCCCSEYTHITERAIDNYLDKDPIFPAAAVIASKITAIPYDILTLYYNHYESQARLRKQRQCRSKVCNPPPPIV